MKLGVVLTKPLEKIELFIQAYYTNYRYQNFLITPLLNKQRLLKGRCNKHIFEIFHNLQPNFPMTRHMKQFGDAAASPATPSPTAETANIRSV